MMKILISALLLFCYEVWALEAVVTVLQTPMFREPRYDSPVIQQLRKGQVIKIHPSIANTLKYEHMAPPPEKYEALKKDLARSEEWMQDPMFKATENKAYSLKDEFVAVLDRQGKTSFVLLEHIYVYFNDTREFAQQVPTKDPMDYRLEEPLPRKYPIKQDTGYRGQVLLGISQPYQESYPYPYEAKVKGYQSPVELNATFLRRTPDDKQDRFYFGGILLFRSFENSFTFLNETKRQSKEKGIKVGLGPYFSYDAYKGIKNRLNINGSVNVYLFNQLDITQTDNTGTDQRVYRTISVGPRLGFQYHRKGVLLEHLDFVFGTTMEIENPSTYHALQGGKEGWWQRPGNDEFKTRAAFSLAAFMGFQSTY